MSSESDSSRAGWVFVISKAGEAPRTVPFQLDMTFGRSSRSSCVLTDPTVSGSHARLIVQEGAPAIEDLGSENGTLIQGGPTLMKGQTFPLEPGVTMRLGETFVALRDDAASPVSADELPTDDATMMQPGGAAQPQEKTAGGDTDDVPALVPAPRPPDPTPAAAPTPPADPAPVDPMQDPAGIPTQEAGQSPAAGGPSAPVSAHPEIPASRISSTTDSSAYEGTIDFGPGGIDGLNAKIAAEGNLRAARPRIVIASQVDRRVDPIEDVEFLIGRGKAARCRISHPAISTPHATIRFDVNEKRFLICDENSKNHTYLNGRMVNHAAPQELESEAHLRFGPVDALFIMEIDVDGVKIPTTRQHFAAQILADSGAISPAQRAAVVRDSTDLGKHVGEALLLAPDPITVKQWTDAMEQARYLEIRTGIKTPLDPRLIAAGVGVVLLIIVLLIVLL